MDQTRVLSCVCRRARAACAIVVCAVFTLASAGVAHAQVGACCLCNGQCFAPASETQCQAQGGLFFPNQSCSQIDCRPWGACCFPASGVCQDGVFGDVCAQQGGQFYVCQDCSQIQCGGTTQACCFCDGLCQDLVPVDCIAASGIPVAGTCVTVTCEPYGACCLPGAGCQDNIRQSQCPTGADFYQCTPCTQQPCGPRACCFCNGACIDLPAADCTLQGGKPQAPGTTCATVQCVPYGACCYLNGPVGPVCVDDVSIVNCPTIGAIFYPCQNCDQVACGVQACCFCDGLCQDLTPANCAAAGGTPQGPGTGCATTICPRIGACCVNQTCVDNWTAAQCQSAGGVFYVCQTCTAALCQPTGACCFTCQPPPPSPPCPDPTPVGPPCIDNVTKANCEQNLHGVYRGDGTTCLLPTGAPRCRCIGDVNGDGVTNISDFNILSGNFGGGIPNCLLHSQGDLNCDGVVNILDFNILAGNFGCQ